MNANGKHSSLRVLWTSIGLSIAVSVPTVVCFLSAVYLPVGTTLSAGFVGLAIFWQLAAVSFLVARRREIHSTEPSSQKESVFDEVTEERLAALEDAGKFISASIGPDELFALIEERARNIVRFDQITFFIFDDEGNVSKTYRTPGSGDPTKENEKLALKAAESAALLLTAADEGGEIAAVPLFCDVDPFGAILFRSQRAGTFSGKNSVLLEAVSERVAPMISGSLARELQESSALTDALTGLPNERAFELVLETRIAEAKRYRNDRELAVAAVDIAGFSKLNAAHGHAMGDRLLAFTGEVIRNALREMDLLARTKDDEFLLVLPGAGADEAKGVLERVCRSLSNSRFEAEGSEGEVISLHFGCALFGPDGESSGDLVRVARMRRNHTKEDRSNQVILFPTKYSN